MPPGQAAGPTGDPRIHRFGSAALTTTAVGGALVVAGTAAGISLPCPLLALTGLPCPGCGMTSLATMVLHGELAGAVTADPGGVLVLAALVLIAGIHAAGGTFRMLDRLRPAIPRLVVVGTGGLGIHWLTTVVTGGALPGR